MNKCQRRLERSAYHEAAHAVAYLYSGLHFKNMQIFDEGEKFSALNVDFRALKDAGFKKSGKAGGVVKATKKKQVMSDRTFIHIGLAGAAAESLRYKHSYIVSLLSSLHEWCQVEPYLHGQTIEFWFKEVRFMMKYYWPGVTALAKELMAHRRIPYKRAFQIFHDVRKEVNL